MQTEMAETHQQDQSAVAAVRGGDAERYRELVERHERRVFAVAWSRLGDAALAEEVAQEAFIRAYRRLWLLGDGAKFSGWIATIARRLAINFGLRHRRELNKRERWALENFSEIAPEKSAAENEPLHSPETLRQTLAELPDAHRECLVLFYLEGKSGAEAAAALGISETALRVRLHRARAVLRERLEDKLEGSLEKLRPSKSLIPVIMAGVLASSTAKAATTGGTGAVIAGVLAKSGVGKWLLPLGSLLSFIFVAPMLLATWLMARMELKNFRDQKGFRARLFKSQIKDRVLLVIVCIIIGLIIIPVLGRLVDRGLFSGSKPETVFFLIAGFVLTFLPFSLRLVAINRNPFFLASIGSPLIIGVACMLAGLNLLPPNGVNLFIIGQALLFLPFYRHRPIRMDYNLFLRAAEGLLPVPDVEPAGIARSKADLIAFARFLGTRWLANNYRWSNEGLTLRLPPANFSQWSGWTDTAFNWSLRQRSWICLGWDGSVTGRLGEKDRRSLAKLRQDEIFPKSGCEAQVAATVSVAWNKFDAGDLDGAERALGQVAESDVFMVSPAKGGFGRLRWLMAILLGLFLCVSLGINLPGCRAQLERLNGLKPVNLTEAQVYQFMCEVSTNPNPIIKHTLSGHAGWTQKRFEHDPANALFSCLVLPETNLFTPRGLEAMRDTVAGGEGFAAWKQSPWRVQSVDSSGLPRRALTCGWIAWSDLNLQPSDLRDYLHTNRFKSYSQEHWDYFLTRRSSWSWVKSERHDVLRVDDSGVTQLRLLRDVNSLDLVNREKLIAQIASVQALAVPPSGQPPIHDLKSVRGLFFTPCYPALQDTFFSLAALEILGGLDRIDREACIEGILRRHDGKGFFTSPSSGGYNEYHIDGSAQDTIAAYESLRILGALDRVKDLEKWQFRVNRRHLAKDEVTWRDIEAWVATQRLQKILRDHKANPDAPWRSLLEP